MTTIRVNDPNDMEIKRKDKTEGRNTDKKNPWQKTELQVFSISAIPQL
jgi:hypothetical protein